MKQMRKYIPVCLVRLFVACMVVVIGIITEEAAAAGFGEVIIKSAERNRKKEEITVKWEPVKRAAGYQFAYKAATQRRYTVRNVRKTTQTFSADSTGAYKIRIRAYQDIKSDDAVTAYYGKWSEIEIEETDREGNAAVESYEPASWYEGMDNLRAVLFLQNILDNLIGNKMLM